MRGLLCFSAISVKDAVSAISAVHLYSTSGAGLPGYLSLGVWYPEKGRWSRLHVLSRLQVWLVSALRILKLALFFFSSSQDVVVVGKTEFEAKSVFIVKQRKMKTPAGTFFSLQNVKDWCFLFHRCENIQLS